MRITDTFYLPYWLTFEIPEFIADKGFITFSYFIDFDYWFIAAWMKF